MKVGCNTQVLSVSVANQHWLELLYASLALSTKAQRALDGLASLPSSGWLGWSFLNCGPSVTLLEQCDSQTHAGPGKRASLGTGWKPAFWRSSAGDSGCTEPQDPSLKPGLGLEALREPWLLPSQAAPQTSQGDWRKVPFATHSSPLLPSIHPDWAEVRREGGAYKYSICLDFFARQWSLQHLPTPETKIAPLGLPSLSC